MEYSISKLQLSKLSKAVRARKQQLLKIGLFLLAFMLWYVFLFCQNQSSFLGTENVSLASIGKKSLRDASNSEEVSSIHKKWINPDLDCEALGRRRPKWISIGAMSRMLSEFVEIYESRPFQHNSGGMLFEHSFFLFFTLRTILPKPSVIIESGAHKGHTSWLIKKTLPDTLLISISPEAPKLWQSDVTYLIRKNFTDFNSINWDDWSFNKKDAFVLLDDHQDNFRRIFLEGSRFGFKRFMIDDNWAYPGGDSLSLRWVCERRRKELWRGWFPDNFNRLKLNQTWEEHLVQGHHMARNTKFYFGFKALFPEGKPSNELSSIISKVSLKEILKSQDKSQFSRRVLITYIEIE